MKKAIEANTDTKILLLEYGSIPIPCLGIFPAEALINRLLRTRKPMKDTYLKANIPDNIPKKLIKTHQRLNSDMTGVAE